MSGTKARLVMAIAPDGTVRVRTEEVKGTGCLDLIDVAESLTGCRTTSSELTDDYYALPDVVGTGETVVNDVDLRE